MDAIEQLTGEVRGIVRQRGLDPLADPAGMRQVVDEVVAGYAERSLSTPLPPMADPAVVSRQVLAAVAGYGQLQPYLDDPEVEEVWVNEPGKVFVARAGIAELTATVLTEPVVRDLVERMLASSGRRVDVSTPFVDAMLPDGSRLHVVIPGITRRYLALNIRKFVLRASRLSDLVALGSLSQAAAAFLEAAVVAGLNVLVSGGTQAGKTTLLNCLAAAIPARERVITVEEVFELSIPLRDVVGMQCRQPSLEGTGEVSLRQLVREALRMRPSRLLVGEVRQAESLDLLIALNSGVPGMCTVHANGASEAVTKMCTLPLLAGENVSARFVVPTVAASVDLVVHIELAPGGRRSVAEVAAVTGQVDGDVVETVPVLGRDGDGQLVATGGRPPHVDRFARAGIDVTALLGG